MVAFLLLLYTTKKVGGYGFIELVFKNLVFDT
jgi:hypothetical protein